jgi:hypothetical protein
LSIFDFDRRILHGKIIPREKHTAVCHLIDDKQPYFAWWRWIGTCHLLNDKGGSPRRAIAPIEIENIPIYLVMLDPNQWQSMPLLRSSGYKGQVISG